MLNTHTAEAALPAPLGFSAANLAMATSQFRGFAGWVRRNGEQSAVANVLIPFFDMPGNETLASTVRSEVELVRANFYEAFKACTSKHPNLTSQSANHYARVLQTACELYELRTREFDRLITEKSGYAPAKWTAQLRRAIEYGQKSTAVLNSLVKALRSETGKEAENQA